MKNRGLMFLLGTAVVFAAASANASVVEMGLEGPDGPENWTMHWVIPGSVAGAVTLPNPVPEYHWWNGCSPTAAGMLFAYWDTYLGKGNLYDGDSSNWDKVNMSMTNPAHYDNEHNIVATWGHKQAGAAKGLTYGSWDRNNDDILNDKASWDSLADFMQTEDGGTYRSKMAQGFIDYAAWDNPTTAVNESYTATAVTDWTETWAEYTAEIDAGYPVHVGIPEHSVLGFGYWTGSINNGPVNDYVVNWTTWGGGWNGVWGLVDFDEVYAYTTLRIEGGVIPEPTSFAIWTLIGVLGLAVGAYRRRKAA